MQCALVQPSDRRAATEGGFARCDPRVLLAASLAPAGVAPSRTSRLRQAALPRALSQA
jgi:hypothetical protein